MSVRQDLEVLVWKDRAEKAEAERDEARALLSRVAEEFLFNNDTELSDEVYEKLEEWEKK